MGALFSALLVAPRSNALPIGAVGKNTALGTVSQGSCCVAVEECPPSSSETPLPSIARLNGCRPDRTDVEDMPTGLDDSHISFSSSGMQLANSDFLLSGPVDPLLALHDLLELPEHSETPFFYTHRFSALIPFHRMTFSPDAIRVLTTPNAGGNSENSEALSFEVLHRLLGARLLKTEMQIHYQAGAKITDYLCILHGHRLGVSVTRAMKHTDPAEFTAADAEALLNKKLYGVNASSEAVSSSDCWERQLLHIWAQSERIATILADVWAALSNELRANTIVVCTVAPNHKWLF
ncbi:putative Signal transducing adapter molecule 2 [Paratrimastix pyriformis]|uniref:Signal transducing adapter molecule 2 n=1 Tax=Paratrimastix pyriformis TaxID=342808 RepID=A0ABQ8UAI0_9EUKA|nr:putative Signal transducing adapter molecule 2 [Paratrimastix pyriformis]|eukprot:GAFH01001704.1.p1 GENE.GAFH01001704.1~~GAFH01001704.1.p1  ORF type:complete len:293 (+),score=10.83 GAFH01001704.1:535-1413(+)